jgi:excisionase family DNA binding protein
MIEYLTVAETAKRLHLCAKTVYNLCNAGELECCRAGRAIRIPIDAEPTSAVKTQPSADRPYF